MLCDCASRTVSVGCIQAAGFCVMLKINTLFVMFYAKKNYAYASPTSQQTNVKSHLRIYYNQPLHVYTIHLSSIHNLLTCCERALSRVNCIQIAFGGSDPAAHTNRRSVSMRERALLLMQFCMRSTRALVLVEMMILCVMWMV